MRWGISRAAAGKLWHRREARAPLLGHQNQRTGEPYTDVEYARMSAGDLTEEEVAGTRTGRRPDPTVS
jgi:hypothetical protein